MPVMNVEEADKIFKKTNYLLYRCPKGVRGTHHMHNCRWLEQLGYNITYHEENDVWKSDTPRMQRRWLSKQKDKEDEENYSAKQSVAQKQRAAALKKKQQQEGKKNDLETEETVVGADGKPVKSEEEKKTAIANNLKKQQQQQSRNAGGARRMTSFSTVGESDNKEEEINFEDSDTIANNIRGDSENYLTSLTNSVLERHNFIDQFDQVHCCVGSIKI